VTVQIFIKLEGGFVFCCGGRREKVIIAVGFAQVADSSTTTRYGRRFGRVSAASPALPGPSHDAQARETVGTLSPETPVLISPVSVSSRSVVARRQQLAKL